MPQQLIKSQEGMFDEIWADLTYKSGSAEQYDQIKSFLSLSQTQLIEGIMEFLESKKGSETVKYNEETYYLGSYDQALDDIRTYLTTLIEKK